MLASIAYGGWLACQPERPLPWLLLPVFLFLRMALNAIDGMLAREHGQKSRLGGILNEVGDVVSDAALYLPFALLLAQPAWVALAVVLALLTEFVGVLGPSGREPALRRADGQERPRLCVRRLRAAVGPVAAGGGLGRLGVWIERRLDGADLRQSGAVHFERGRACLNRCCRRH